MNDDLISRQAAIDTYLETVSSLCVDEGDGMLTACARDRDILEMLENLPSVQPKTGHWIEDAKTYYEELKKRSLGVDEYTPYFTDDIACSECLAKYSVLDNETQFFKYCPNCGAKMEGETE